jgi:uncharacterized protein DUF1579
MGAFASALAVLMLAIFLPAAVRAQQPAGSSVPPMVQRAMPGAGQQALQPLAGMWRVEKSLYVAIGTPDHPVLSANMVTHREWIGDGRFLRDTTEGIIGGMPYFRTGFLGYNNIDRRYEWVTADNVTPTLMSYRAKTGSGVQMPIDMAGSFSDLGLTGEQNVGKTIPMRTLIRVENNDRNVFEIYFTPPGGAEVLADRMVFMRVK